MTRTKAARRLLCCVLLAAGASVSARGQSGAAKPPAAAPSPAPLFHIIFTPGEAVQGLSVSPVIMLPFECTSDGTVFVSMMTPPDFRGHFLTSVAPSGEAHTFRLDTVPDLFDVREADRFAFDGGVIFLVQAARENNQTRQGFVTSGGAQGEFTRNAAEHNFFAVMFDRTGKYQRTTQIQDTFHVIRLGVFPSGLFLAYGYDDTDRAPKLALLKEDGVFLEYLQIPDGDTPKEALAKDPRTKSAALFIAPVQMVGRGSFIDVVQDKTAFPVLEVNEAGAIRPIAARLPDGAQINNLLPSDEQLYARINEMGDGSIYEFSSLDGSVMRRFQVGDDESGADIACVHEGKFLSFQHGTGALIPLVGTAEPMPLAEKQGGRAQPDN